MVSLICGIEFKKKKQRTQNRYTNSTKQDRVTGTEKNLVVAMGPETKQVIQRHKLQLQNVNHALCCPYKTNIIS